jgi:hypothetical protein
MSVEVEIYVSNIIKFFKENPNDLESLVPRTKEEEFFEKLREASYKNFENGVDVVLTQSQIIEIVEKLTIWDNLPKYYQMTKIGLLHLN